MKGMEETPVPLVGRVAWNVFMELVNRRPTRGAPIPFTEIKAYAELTGQELTPVDVQRLMAMDRAFLDAIPRSD